MAKNSTISQIAENFGVTEATVYRAINNHGKGAYKRSAKRSRQIREMAEQLGYRANASARAARTGRTGCIGMLVSPVVGTRVDFTPDLERGIIEELAACNQYMAKGYLPANLGPNTDALPRLITEWTADGLLINYTHEIPHQVTELVDRHDVPAVWINSRHDTNCVYPDDRGAAIKGTEFLLGLGHRKILAVHPAVWWSPNRHSSTTDRFAGYSQAMRKAGLAPRIIDCPELVGIAIGDDSADRLQVARAVLERRDGATAILVVDGRTTVPFILAAGQMGLRVPDDLSVLGFEHGPQGSVPAEWDVHRARIAVPFEQVGRAAVRMVNHKIDNDNAACPPKVIAFGVTDGPTVGRPPQFNAPQS